MQIQPEMKKPPFKFDKIEIPLTEEDLVIRERPRRLPPPPPEGGPENAHDRRPLRPKRPKPERRSFESFQEDLAAKVESEANGGEPVAALEVVETTVIEVPEGVVNAPATEGPINAQVPEVTPPTAPAADEFGEGL